MSDRISKPVQKSKLARIPSLQFSHVYMSRPTILTPLLAAHVARVNLIRMHHIWLGFRVLNFLVSVGVGLKYSILFEMKN
jgi:hypothetical protein